MTDVRVRNDNDFREHVLRRSAKAGKDVGQGSYHAHQPEHEATSDAIPSSTREPSPRNAKGKSSGQTDPTKDGVDLVFPDFLMARGKLVNVVRSALYGAGDKKPGVIPGLSATSEEGEAAERGLQAQGSPAGRRSKTTSIDPRRRIPARFLPNPTIWKRRLQLLPKKNVSVLRDAVQIVLGELKSRSKLTGSVTAEVQMHRTDPRRQTDPPVAKDADGRDSSDRDHGVGETDATRSSFRETRGSIQEEGQSGAAGKAAGNEICPNETSESPAARGAQALATRDDGTRQESAASVPAVAKTEPEPVPTASTRDDASQAIDVHASCEQDLGAQIAPTVPAEGGRTRREASQLSSGPSINRRLVTLEKGKTQEVGSTGRKSLSSRPNAVKEEPELLPQHMQSAPSPAQAIPPLDRLCGAQVKVPIESEPDRASDSSQSGVVIEWKRSKGRQKIGNTTSPTPTPRTNSNVQKRAALRLDQPEAAQGKNENVIVPVPPPPPSPPPPLPSTPNMPKELSAVKQESILHKELPGANESQNNACQTFKERPGNNLVLTVVTKKVDASVSKSQGQNGKRASPTRKERTGKSTPLKALPANVKSEPALVSAEQELVAEANIDSSSTHGRCKQKKSVKDTSVSEELKHMDAPSDARIGSAEQVSPPGAVSSEEPTTAGSTTVIETAPTTQAAVKDEEILQPPTQLEALPAARKPTESKKQHEDASSGRVHVKRESMLYQTIPRAPAPAKRPVSKRKKSVPVKQPDAVKKEPVLESQSMPPVESASRGESGGGQVQDAVTVEGKVIECRREADMRHCEKVSSEETHSEGTTATRKAAHRTAAENQHGLEDREIVQTQRTSTSPGDKPLKSPAQEGSQRRHCFERGQEGPLHRSGTSADAASHTAAQDPCRLPFTLKEEPKLESGSDMDIDDDDVTQSQVQQQPTPGVDGNGAVSNAPQGDKEERPQTRPEEGADHISALSTKAPASIVASARVTESAPEAFLSEVMADLEGHASDDDIVGSAGETVTSSSSRNLPHKRGTEQGRNQSDALNGRDGDTGIQAAGRAGRHGRSGRRGEIKDDRWRSVSPDRSDASGQRKDLRHIVRDRNRRDEEPTRADDSDGKKTPLRAERPSVDVIKSEDPSVTKLIAGQASERKEAAPPESINVGGKVITGLNRASQSVTDVAAATTPVKKVISLKGIRESTSAGRRAMLLEHHRKRQEDEERSRTEQNAAVIAVAGKSCETGTASGEARDKGSGFYEITLIGEHGRIVTVPVPMVPADTSVSSQAPVNESKELRVQKAANKLPVQVVNITAGNMPVKVVNIESGVNGSARMSQSLRANTGPSSSRGRLPTTSATSSKCCSQIVVIDEGNSWRVPTNEQGRDSSPGQPLKREPTSPGREHLRAREKRQSSLSPPRGRRRLSPPLDRDRRRKTINSGHDGAWATKSRLNSPTCGERRDAHSRYDDCNRRMEARRRSSLSPDRIDAGLRARDRERELDRAMERERDRASERRYQDRSSSRERRLRDRPVDWRYAAERSHMKTRASHEHVHNSRYLSRSSTRSHRRENSPSPPRRRRELFEARDRRAAGRADRESDARRPEDASHARTTEHPRSTLQRRSEETKTETLERNRDDRSPRKHKEPSPDRKRTFEESEMCEEIMATGKVQPLPPVPVLKHKRMTPPTDLSPKRIPEPDEVAPKRMIEPDEATTYQVSEPYVATQKFVSEQNAPTPKHVSKPGIASTKRVQEPDVATQKRIVPDGATLKRPMPDGIKSSTRAHPRVKSTENAQPTPRKSNGSKEPMAKPVRAAMKGTMKSMSGSARQVMKSTESQMDYQLVSANVMDFDDDQPLSTLQAYIKRAPRRHASPRPISQKPTDEDANGLSEPRKASAKASATTTGALPKTTKKSGKEYKKQRLHPDKIVALQGLQDLPKEQTSVKDFVLRRYPLRKPGTRTSATRQETPLAKDAKAMNYGPSGLHARSKGMKATGNGAKRESEIIDRSWWLAASDSEDGGGHDDDNFLLLRQPQKDALGDDFDSEDEELEEGTILQSRGGIPFVHSHGMLPATTPVQNATLIGKSLVTVEAEKMRKQALEKLTELTQKQPPKSAQKAKTRFTPHPLTEIGLSGLTTDEIESSEKIPTLRRLLAIATGFSPEGILDITFVGDVAVVVLLEAGAKDFCDAISHGHAGDQVRVLAGFDQHSPALVKGGHWDYLSNEARSREAVYRSIARTRRKLVELSKRSYSLDPDIAESYKMKLEQELEQLTATQTKLERPKGAADTEEQLHKQEVVPQATGSRAKKAAVDRNAKPKRGR